MYKKFVVLIALVLSVCAPVVSAQQTSAKDAEMQQWLQEMRQYKQNFFAKELELSRDQQNKFFPLFEEMENQTFTIDKEARDMEKRVSEMANPSDTELEKATEALYDARLKTAQIEKDYLEKFKPILTRKQLFNLNSVQRKFQREMMKQHNRLRKAIKSGPKKEAAQKGGTQRGHQMKKHK